MKRGGVMERLLDRLRPAGVSAQDVRAETWALGSRHKGEVVAGRVRSWPRRASSRAGPPC